MAMPKSSQVKFPIKTVRAQGHTGNCFYNIKIDSQCQIEQEIRINMIIFRDDKAGYDKKQFHYDWT